MRNVIATIVQLAGLVGLAVAVFMYLPVEVAALVTVSAAAFIVGFLLVDE